MIIYRMILKNKLDYLLFLILSLGYKVCGPFLFQLSIWNESMNFKYIFNITFSSSSAGSSG